MQYVPNVGRRLSFMAEEIEYEDMLVYVARIREAYTPLGILVNTDFLTDLLDQHKITQEEVMKRYGIKTQMERNKLRDSRRTAQRNFQLHRLFQNLREVNSHYKSEVCRQ